MDIGITGKVLFCTAAETNNFRADLFDPDRIVTRPGWSMIPGGLALSLV